MKITIVTDHRFYKCGDHIYDDYVFNYSFFTTFLKVFDHVTIVCRIKNTLEIDPKWALSSGRNVTFISIPDEHGIRWLFLSKRYFVEKKIEILDTDCFCFRVPSVAAWWVFKLNGAQIPYMFESIGDPADAMVSTADNPIKRVIFNLLGKVLTSRKRAIVLGSAVGSYVSMSHLQEKFPVNNGVFTESISSIRLDKKYILEKKTNFQRDSIEITHIGSFIPLKNQRDLILAFKKLVSINSNMKLNLVGEGVTRQSCLKLVCDLNIESNVIFHGQVTGFDNIVEILDRSTVFILPSSNEGMPRALIEAMARGLLCFGSNVGGIAELLSDEFTFNPGDINGIVRVVQKKCLEITDIQWKTISDNNIKKASYFSNELLEAKRINILNVLKSKVDERA